jgi:hypothetical protein
VSFEKCKKYKMSASSSQLITKELASTFQNILKESQSSSHQLAITNVESDDVSVQVTLTTTCLFAEFQRLNVYPFCTMNIGNHEVYLTPDDTFDKPEKLLFEYCGLIWLFKNRSKDKLQAVVSFRSMQKFMAFKYGMSLFEVYKNPEKAQSSINKSELKAILQDAFVTEDSQQVSSLLAKTKSNNVIVATDDFGLITYPSSEDMNMFLSKAKVAVGGYDTHIKQRVNTHV